MSLLNDALRAAEQRQQRPAPAAYTGRATAVKRRSRGKRLVVLIPVAALLVALAVFGWEHWKPEPAAPVASAEAVARPAPVQARPDVETPAKPMESLAGEDGGKAPPKAKPVAEPEPSVVPALAIEQPRSAPEARRAEPPSARRTSVASAQTKAPAVPAQDTARTDLSPPVSEPLVAAVAEEPPSAPVIKNRRQTPEAMDRDLSRELKTLIADGQIPEAQNRLERLLESQAAPMSRAVMARALLVDGRFDEALKWLPASAVTEQPELRLLRARALLSLDDLYGALATLQSQVPSVERYPEYRVTLATLLQKAGNGAEAARHWSALLTVDDSRAAWWVGLALALESEGQIRSAIRAYGQAAALPGLSPVLADFVRERLQTLQAG